MLRARFDIAEANDAKVPHVAVHRNDTGIGCVGGIVTGGVRSHVREVHDLSSPWNGREAKEYVGNMKRTCSLDVVTVRRRGALHRGLRPLRGRAGHAFRNHDHLEYEIPMYDEESGSPGLFTPLDRAICEPTIEQFMRQFRSGTSWSRFTEETS